MDQTGLPPEAERALAAGQDHLFRFWDELDDDARATFLTEIRGIDFELVARLTRDVLSAPAHRPSLAPIEALSRDHPELPAALEAGRELFRQARVAYYTVAGGQGTRLGFPGPKGCFPIAPVSGKTLFTWHAENVIAASRRYGRSVPWVIMVSETNEAETREYFEGEGWFGIEGDIRLVPQRMLPAVDENGRILLREKGRIALSPNGHGGAIDALARSGTLDWLRERGVDTVSFFQIDNALVNPADIAFLGFHALRGAEMSSKAVLKEDPAEKAGVIARLDGKPGVIEYSEISDEDAAQREPDGQLTYRLASIAAHVFSLSFLERIQADGLPWHAAVKKVPTLDADGAPTEVTGQKFETFIFDTIPLARGFIAWLADRSQEFSPLKNADGDNSAATVRRDLLDRTRAWYENAAATAPESDDDLELSPLTAYDQETFSEWLAEKELR